MARPNGGNTMLSGPTEPKSEDLDAEHEIDDVADARPKKKRRAVKMVDKKHECPQQGCGKKYSRAEHLYRHQLNHNPKQIFHCDFPACQRNFVRADLCARHRKRHTAKGSHLQRKDAFIHRAKASSMSDSTSTSPPLTDVVNASPADAPLSQWVTSKPEQYQSMQTSAPLYSDALNNTGSSAFANLHLNTSAMDIDPHMSSKEHFTAPYILDHTNAPALTSYAVSSSTRDTTVRASLQRSTSYDAASGYSQSAFTPLGQSITPNQAMPTSSRTSAATVNSQPYPPASPQAFKSPSNHSSLPSLPPFGFPPAFRRQPSSARSNSVISPPGVHSIDQVPMPPSRNDSLNDFNVLDQMPAGYSMPVFGGDTVNRSPQNWMSDAFVQSLFNGGESIEPSPPSVVDVNQSKPSSTALPKLEPDGLMADQALKERIAAGTNMINDAGVESELSQAKRQRIIALVSDKFTDTDQMPMRKRRDSLFSGDPGNDPTHVLSLHMMQSYLASYWLHVHQQLPILHRPTFNSETIPELLILAMMALGACCLEKVHPWEITQNCAEFSFFVAWHVRWEVFRDADFRPSAKMWTFQAMLLLELFEKMYATRPLHERAHIHHATTLAVMRRGSSLIPRSMNSPPDAKDPTRTPPGPNGSINTSGQNTADAWWNRWITAEATRRVAFAAFLIDSTHATMFGHTAILAPQDIEQALPCDEAIWAAPSSAEVQRLEQQQTALGFKPMTLLEGIKRTLSGHKVRTNTFGRVVIMAGLLNVSWQMKQRDLQVSSLGVSNALGSASIKWRGPLTRAFDLWRRGFDDYLANCHHWVHPADGVDRANVFESRTVLHSLAHMAMQVDIIDCQVFAGADRLLGRSIGEADRQRAQKRMREQWAPSARARDATFYALRFLCEVLLPDEQWAPHAKPTPQPRPPHAPPTFTYSARDDCLLNRPWVLYFASLTVWAYGYALDGPIKPRNSTLSRELQVFDMHRYLLRMGGVAAPDELERQRDRNSCLGLLLLLKDCFAKPRWELLHDASAMLGRCIDMLLPGGPGA